MVTAELSIMATVAVGSKKQKNKKTLNYKSTKSNEDIIDLFINPTVWPDHQSRQVTSELVCINSLLGQITGTNSQSVFQSGLVKGPIWCGYNWCVVFSINVQLGRTTISNYYNVMPLGIKDAGFVQEFCIAVEVAAYMNGLTSMHKQQLGSRGGQREMYAIETFLVGVGNDGLTAF